MSICNLGTFLQIPDFMTKYGNFQNWPVSRILLHVEQNQGQFRPRWVGGSICNVWNFFQIPDSYQNMSIMVIRLYLENGPKL